MYCNNFFGEEVSGGNVFPLTIGEMINVSVNRTSAKRVFCFCIIKVYLNDFKNLSRPVVCLSIPFKVGSCQVILFC